MPIIDENIPRAPNGKKRFLDIVIANNTRRRSSNLDDSASETHLYPSQTSLTTSVRQSLSAMNTQVAKPKHEIRSIMKPIPLPTHNSNSIESEGHASRKSRSRRSSYRHHFSIDEVADRAKYDRNPINIMFSNYKQEVKEKYGES